MENKNPLWSRRTNMGNLSLATTQAESSSQPRDYSSLRRNGPQSSHGRTNPFSATTPGGGLTSPTGVGSSAFGLGSGAFASFGSAKTPKTPGNPFELAMGGMGSKTTSAEKSSKETLGSAVGKGAESEKEGDASQAHPLRESWTYWTRPPISKANGFIEYEKTLHSIASVSTVEEFWNVYKHVKKPSELSAVTDIHFFKRDVRPIWEDDENKAGGKWILRVKKGIADRYWDDILMGCVGDQFGEFRDCVNGAVLSVRNGEDIISIWTSTTGQKVLKLRDILRTLLQCPPNTQFEFKSHDDSIQQRHTIDEQRREKAAAGQLGSDNNKRTSRTADLPRMTQEELLRGT